jgi:hypothetical protein
MNRENKYDAEDGLMRELFQQAGKRRPSDGFTRRVMDRIEPDPVPKAVSYKPVIPTRGWIGIILAALILVIYSLVISGTDPESGVLNELLHGIDLGWMISWMDRLGSSVLDLRLSSQIMYSVLAIALVWLMEILLRKNFRMRRS